MKEEAKTKIKDLNQNKNIINKVIDDITCNELDNKKYYKHLPFYQNIKNIFIDNDKNQIQIKGEGANTKIFNTNETNRSFSLTETYNEHTNYILETLNNEIQIINIMIEQLETIIKKVKPDENDIYYFNYIMKTPYNVDDFYTYKQTKLGYRYYLSICPIYGFYVSNNNIAKISNKYTLCFESNNKFTLLYEFNNKFKFKRLLGRPLLKNFIEDFNNNSTKIVSTQNLLQICDNIQSLIHEFTKTNQLGEKSEHNLQNIDFYDNDIINHVIKNVFQSVRITFPNGREFKSEQFKPLNKNLRDELLKNIINPNDKDDIPENEIVKYL
jgi:hypothetical protein